MDYFGWNKRMVAFEIDMILEHIADILAFEFRVDINQHNSY